MPIYWTISERLKEKGWTRYRLAREMGVEPSTVYKLLRRKRAHVAEEPTLSKLCEALGVQPGDLLEYKKR